MNETNSTNLRANLFKYLERAALGSSFKVNTKFGAVLIVSENSLLKKPSRSSNSLRPKIKGSIVDSLDSADSELSSHILIPKKR